MVSGTYNIVILVKADIQYSKSLLFLNQLALFYHFFCKNVPELLGRVSLSEYIKTDRAEPALYKRDCRARLIFQQQKL
jgi:hypothetical protein